MTARLAARAARLDAAMNAAVARVTAALPAIGAEDARAALKAAVPATMKGKGPPSLRPTDAALSLPACQPSHAPGPAS